MKRTVLVISLVLGMVAVGSPAGAQFVIPPWDGDPSTVVRIEGDTPRTFAINLARTLDDRSRGVALVVSDQTFADALSASGLAQFGVFFFAGPDRGLDPDALSEIQRLMFQAEQTVYIVGGTAAVSADVEGQITAIGHRPVRLSGPTRFETSVAVADEVVRNQFGGELTEAFLARAFGPDDNPTAAWADSVSGGPAAATRGVPMLLTGGDALHPAIAAWLTQNTPARVTVLGGTAAVPQAVVDQVPAPTRRVSGATRDETAEQIVHRVLRDTFGLPMPLVAVNLFDDMGWAYGLATSSVAADQAAGIVAVHPDVDLASSQRLVACSRPVDLIVAGSTSVVPQAGVDAMRTCPSDLNAGSDPTSPITLRGDGVGAAIDFGLSAEDTVAALTSRLGDPVRDSGRVQPFCELAGPDDPAGRTVEFANGLVAGFRELSGEMFFHFWDYGPGSGDLRTLLGIGLGSSNDDVRAAHGADARLLEGDPNDFPPPIWTIDTAEGPMNAFPNGNDAADTVTLLSGGDLNFCE